MNAITLALVSSLLGVDVGWQPLDGGGFEYIIQIEPQLLDTLKSGNDLVSDLPPQLQGVRTYRIKVGNSRLPRIGERPLDASDGNSAQSAATPEPKGTAGNTPAPTNVAADGLQLNAPAPFTAPEGTRDLGAARATNEAAVQKPSNQKPSPQKPPVAQTPDNPSPDNQLLPSWSEYQLTVVTAELPPAPATPPEKGPVPDAVATPSAAEKVTGALESDPKPWGMLTLATLGLFLSLGFNAFLGWVTWGFRQRYAALVQQADGAQAA